MQELRPPTIPILGIPVHSTTLEQAAEHVVRSSVGGTGGWVITPNLDILRRTARDPSFRELYDQSTLRLADGMPLVWASRLRRTPLPERVAGSDLIFRLVAKAAEQGASIFLLGGNPGAAEKTAEILTAKHPALKIAGIACPEFGFEKDPAKLDALTQSLIAARPNIVLVALGSPKQEHLILHLRTKLPAAWFLGIGITFSFVAGEVQRAPVWMRRVGLEWSHRLLQEPRRLAKRYLIDGLPFAAYLFAKSALEGLRKADGPAAATVRPSVTPPR
jgi:N-acetylglucosaminyldiphosphoundecaprenol N-acetyl-beta-D-mannosaminyltransferase